MNDLLNEEEFLQNPYNYTRRFSMYCIVAFILNVVFAAKILLDKPEDMVIALSSIGMVFLFPIALCCAMIFAEKKVITLEIKTITWGMAALFCSCFAGICITMLVLYSVYSTNFSVNPLWPLLPVIVANIITFGITAGVIRYIVKWKKKYKNGRDIDLPQ